MSFKHNPGGCGCCEREECFVFTICPSLCVEGGFGIGGSRPYWRVDLTGLATSAGDCVAGCSELQTVFLLAHDGTAACGWSYSGTFCSGHTVDVTLQPGCVGHATGPDLDCCFEIGVKIDGNPVALYLLTTTRPAGGFFIGPYSFTKYSSSASSACDITWPSTISAWAACDADDPGGGTAPGDCEPCTTDPPATVFVEFSSVECCEDVEGLWTFDYDEESSSECCMFYTKSFGTVACVAFEFAAIAAYVAICYDSESNQTTIMQGWIGVGGDVSLTPGASTTVSGRLDCTGFTHSLTSPDPDACGGAGMVGVTVSA